MTTGESGPLRMLVVGAGRMGRVHLDAISRTDAVQVTAIVEPHEPTREQLAGLDAAVYADLQSALDAGGFDAALIAAPSGFHVGLVNTLMEHAVPTLCEKPCGLLSDGIRGAAQRAADTGTRLQIGYWRRFVAELQTLRDEIETGLVGEITFVQAWQWDGEPPAAGFRVTSGGPLLDMGVHEFDMIRWLTGQDLELVDVVDSRVNSVEPVAGDPESVLATARLSGGGVAVISLGRRFDRGDCCWVEVIGTLGSRRCEFMIGDAGNDVFQQALVHQVEAFAASVRGAAPLGATAADAIAALEAVETGTPMFANNPSS